MKTTELEKIKKLYSTPLMKAQEICKNAIFESFVDVKKVYDNLISEGLINDYEYEIEPWNNGYQLKVTTEVDYKKIQTVANQNLVNFIYGNVCIFIQPNTFFNDYYTDGNARFECRLIKSDKDQKEYVNYQIDENIEGSTMENLAKRFVVVNKARLLNILTILNPSMPY